MGGIRDTDNIISLLTRSLTQVSQMAIANAPYAYLFKYIVIGDSGMRVREWRVACVEVYKRT